MSCISVKQEINNHDMKMNMGVAFEVRPLRTFIPMLLFLCDYPTLFEKPVDCREFKSMLFQLFMCISLFDYIFFVIKTVVISSINASKTSICYASVRDIAKGDVFSIQNRMFYDELVWVIPYWRLTILQVKKGMSKIYFLLITSEI